MVDIKQLMILITIFINYGVVNMALWQVYFNIVEKNKEQDDDVLLWERDIIKIAKEITFLEENSWSDSILQYGKSDLTCIEIYLDDDKKRVEEISVRIDLRELDFEMIHNILKYIMNLDADIYYNDKIYNPDIKTIKEILISSDAFKFCKSPHEYIENIGRTVK